MDCSGSCSMHVCVCVCVCGCVSVWVGALVGVWNGVRVVVVEEEEGLSPTSFLCVFVSVCGWVCMLCCKAWAVMQSSTRPPLSLCVCVCVFVSEEEGKIVVLLERGEGEGAASASVSKVAGGVVPAEGTRFIFFSPSCVCVRVCVCGI
jgi:hypothetical protein